MKVILTLIYISVVGLVSFFFGLSLPRDCFDENKFPYKGYGWENKGKIYECCNVKTWKTKVPDMSMVSKKLFPKKLNRHLCSDDLDRLVKESCVAEMIHYILCIFGIGIYNIWKSKIGVILVIVYILVGNVPYIIIQRYNRPNLMSIRDRLIIREERFANAVDKLPIVSD